MGPTVEPTATYGGSCRVTTDNLVIEDVVVNCQDTGLVVDATGVVIRNAIVRGGVYTAFGHSTPAAEDNNHPTVFTVEDSRVYAGTTPSNNRAFGYAHFEIRNSYLEGAQSGGWAANKAVLVGNYITTDGTSSHQSGVRMLKNSTLRGNTVSCTPTPGTGVDGGCSADAVFYREFGVPVNLTIEGNYFKRGTGDGQWFAVRFIDCAQQSDCLGLKFTGNQFDRGQGTDGGEFPMYGGNVWSNNSWTDGVPALSDQSR